MYIHFRSHQFNITFDIVFTVSWKRRLPAYITNEQGLRSLGSLISIETYHENTIRIYSVRFGTSIERGTKEK